MVSRTSERRRPRFPAGADTRVSPSRQILVPTVAFLLILRAGSRTCPRGSRSVLGEIGGGGIGGWVAMGDLRALGRVPLVLVIEDDQTQRQMLLRMLESAAYEAIGVGDGENGLRAVVEHQPDLVLLDLNLPRIDGFEVCRRLRADPLTATLPGIIITAHRANQDMVEALDSCAGDFLTKPFQQVELLARMRSAFRLRRAITSLERTAQI